MADLILVNIIFLSLIIIILNLISCSDVSKSYCEEILDYSYTENDSLIENNISLAKKCAEKYHKRLEFLQKISQIYYYDAIEDYSSNNPLQATRKLYNALYYINNYITKSKSISRFMQ